MSLNQLQPYRFQDIQSVLHTKQECLQIMQVSGDMMVPEYFPRDYVLVDINHRTPYDGDFVLQNSSGVLEVKKLQVFLGRGPQKIRVINVNKSYESFLVNYEDITIVGRVVGKWVWK